MLKVKKRPRRTECRQVGTKGFYAQSGPAVIDALDSKWRPSAQLGFQALVFVSNGHKLFSAYVESNYIKARAAPATVRLFKGTFLVVGCLVPQE